MAELEVNAVLIESVVEQYRFSCARCGKQWADSYDARHVTDLEGDIYSFYGHGGLPCEAPSAAETVCPRCHCGPVTVTFLGRHAAPAITT